MPSRYSLRSRRAAAAAASSAHCMACFRASCSEQWRSGMRGDWAGQVEQGHFRAHHPGLPALDPPAARSPFSVQARRTGRKLDHQRQAKPPCSAERRQQRLGGWAVGGQRWARQRAPPSPAPTLGPVTPRALLSQLIAGHQRQQLSVNNGAGAQVRGLGVFTTGGSTGISTHYLERSKGLC